MNESLGQNMGKNLVLITNKAPGEFPAVNRILILFSDDFYIMSNLMVTDRKQLMIPEITPLIHNSDDGNTSSRKIIDKTIDLKWKYQNPLFLFPRTTQEIIKINSIKQKISKIS